jgi:hypothetical protein
LDTQDDKRRRDFLDDVEKLGIRRPATDMAKKLGLYQGYVCRIMTGESTVSEQFFEDV